MQHKKMLTVKDPLLDHPSHQESHIFRFDLKLVAASHLLFCVPSEVYHIWKHIKATMRLYSLINISDV